VSTCSAKLTIADVDVEFVHGDVEQHVLDVNDPFDKSLFSVLVVPRRLMLA